MELPETLDRAIDSPAERASILLADNDPAARSALRAILGELGHNLVEARSSEEALDRAKAQEFAAILLDMRLTGLGGFDTAQAIRADERSRTTPIIFLAEDGIDRDQIERGYALGAVDVLVKPPSPVVLRAKVRGLVTLFQEKQRARHEAEQLRLLVHGTTDYAIFMLDPQGRVATWNAGAERLKGYRADEIIGQHFSRFYPQEALDRGWPDHELEVAAAEGRFEDEGWRLRKDGSLFWANVVITAVRADRGDLVGFSKVTRDLTERKRAEESLRRSEERFRLLVEGAKDYAIFMLDPEGHVASWNAGAERIKGYSAEEIIGQHFSRFYPQEAIERGWPDHELEVAAAEGRFEDEGWRVRKDGSQFWANVVITALKDERGDLLGFSKITRDMTERKRAEEDARRLVEEAAARRVAERDARLIREQRERLHVTLASIGDAVISTDAQGRVEFLNPVAEELLGWTTEEAAGRTLGDVFHIVNEGTRRPVENPALRALCDGRIVGLANHTVLISRNETERPIDDSAAPIRDADGTVIGSVLVFRDISEQRRAEQHRNARLAVTQALSEAASVDDGAGGVLEAVCGHLGWELGLFWAVNEGGEALVCRSRWHGPDDLLAEFGTASCTRTFARGEGLPGRVWAAGKPAWIPDVRLDTDFPRLASAASCGLRSAFAYPVGVGGQTLGVIEFFTRRIREADAELLETMGTVAGNVGQFVERKAAEEELRRSERELSDFFENATVGLHWVGPDGTILRANRTELDMLGYSREEYVGRRIADFHADEAVICDILKRLQAGEELREYPARLRCKDGSIKDVLIDSSVMWRDGQFVHTRCFTRDVTERRRAEEALRAAKEEAEAANQAKTQFLAVLSHELRTPLNPILLAASSMLERPPEPGEIRPTLEMIRQNVHLQARLIDDLLDVMRIVRGKMPLHWEVADGHKLIDHAVEVCRSEVLSKRLHLEADLAAAHRHVNADPARLQQVFWNLIKNAVKFQDLCASAVDGRRPDPSPDAGGTSLRQMIDELVAVNTAAARSWASDCAWMRTWPPPTATSTPTRPGSSRSSGT